MVSTSPVPGITHSLFENRLNEFRETRGETGVPMQKLQFCFSPACHYPSPEALPSRARDAVPLNFPSLSFSLSSNESLEKSSPPSSNLFILVFHPLPFFSNQTTPRASGGETTREPANRVSLANERRLNWETRPPIRRHYSSFLRVPHAIFGCV